VTLPSERHPPILRHLRPVRPRRQIIAMGGGGFSEEPDNPALDEYVLRASGADHPRVCFLPTAGGDNSSYTLKFYRAFAELGARPSHLQLFHRTVEDVRRFLLSQDVIYVGGGNTAAMLAVWRVHGLDHILREAWERGVLLAGLCAGSMCWFESGVTASWGPRMAPLEDGLGLLPGSNCPHHELRRDVYSAFVAGGMRPGWAAEDGVALHFTGRELSAVVSSRPGRFAHRVELVGDEVVETPVEPTLLPAPAAPPRAALWVAEPA
jgi:peptidase E